MMFLDSCEYSNKHPVAVFSSHISMADDEGPVATFTAGFSRESIWKLALASVQMMMFSEWVGKCGENTVFCKKNEASNWKLLKNNSEIKAYTSCSMPCLRLLAKSILSEKTHA
ncbi:MAG: hypothetical protein LBT92_02305 [Rickettsiales bacterium]|jgi:hypothetical protein|nr:hypothetical protein [Rickettsiales bacterium]